jgi:hypothetical protein
MNIGTVVLQCLSDMFHLLNAAFGIGLFAIIDFIFMTSLFLGE